MSATVAIPGINGAQQRAIADAFSTRGWSVRGTRRDGDGPRADLATGAGLDAAFAGAGAVVFTLPQDHRAGAIVAMADHVARAADDAGVGRLVVNLATRIDDAAQGPLFDDLRAVRERVLAARTPVTVLQTTVYMDNLLEPWALPAIVRDGVLAYPAPAAVPVSWLSHRTLGEACVAVARRPDAAGRVIDIGGPDALTGDALAERLGAAIGRPIAYAQVPLDAFAAGLNAAFGAPAGDRIASLYRHVERHPEALRIDPEWADALGVVPESFDDFARRVAWSMP